jgi:hypothetical protein
MRLIDAQFLEAPWYGSRRHCQVNRLQNKFRLLMPAHQALSHLLDRRLLSPGPKRFGPSAPIARRAEAMTPWPEVAVDDGVCREKVLRLVP